MTFWHFFSVLKLSNLGFCSQNVEPDLLHSRPRTGQKRTGRVSEGIFGQLESYAVRRYKICPLAVKSWYFFSLPTLGGKTSKLGGVCDKNVQSDLFHSRPRPGQKTYRYGIRGHFWTA